LFVSKCLDSFRTSTSFAGAIGFATYASIPAEMHRRRSSAVAVAVTATIRGRRLAPIRATIFRVACKPSVTGI
jgi:hypothetical protein